MNLQELKLTYSQVMKETAQFVADFDWTDHACYTMWLAQSFHFVKHSTRLLAMASAHAPISNEPLHRRMNDHLKEELGHEKLALNDLRALNIAIETIPELFETRAFYQSQYYWIQQTNSSSFLGYILFLEGLAAQQGPELLTVCLQAFGPKATMFLKVHAEEDQGHIEKAFASLANLPETELDLIAINMQESAQLYRNMLSEITALTKASSATNASSTRTKVTPIYIAN